MAKALTDTIRENAEGPAEVTGDSGSMKQHPLRDQIEADRYASAKGAAQSKTRGLNRARFVPPGAA